MLVSLSWLKQYIDLPDSTTSEEIGEKLKAGTVEVDGINNLAKNLSGVVVGRVVSAVKHPDADKLKLCQVDVGAEKLQIVCGGSNVRVGMLVALAKVGAKVRWHGEGELVELGPAKIRGLESFGMICASTEIGLGSMFPLKDEKEILDLTNVSLNGNEGFSGLVNRPSDSSLSAQNDDRAGVPLARALGLDDAVFEIDNKSLSNRPDLWGHYGIAREVAALFNKNLLEYKTKKIVKLKKSALKLKVEVKDIKMCPRYMAVAMSGIKVGPSPDWLKQKLAAVGVNSINNIVDIANFVMLDLGSPMHAFDASKLRITNYELRITVRPAVNGEMMEALDGKKYELNANDLVIASEDKVLALAGVIGGIDSAISDTTTEIIFESANFNPVNIRKTSTRLGIRTDSAQRFEKSLDPNWCPLALQKAVELVERLCPGATVASVTADERNFQLNSRPIEISVDYFRKKIGVEIGQKKIVGILTKLGFAVKEKKEKLTVVIPSWRATKDVSIAEDLVEEVLRINGYDSVPAALPEFSINSPEVNTLRKLERQIKKILALASDYSEVYNYSFITPETAVRFGDEIAKYIELENPIAKDRPFLRREIAPGLVENLEKNQHHGDRIKLFEIGKVFNAEESGARISEKSDALLPRQETKLGMVFSQKKEGIPYYEMTSDLTKLGQELGVEFELRRIEDSQNYFHPGRAAEIFVGGNLVGTVGELHPVIQAGLRISEKVAILELSLDELNSRIEPANKYRPLSPYPIVVRDIAFLVDKTVEHQNIVGVIQSADELVYSVNLFDVFEGDNVPLGKKSLAYRITYQSVKKTLTALEVETAHNKITRLLSDKFGVEIR